MSAPTLRQPWLQWLRSKAARLHVRANAPACRPAYEGSHVTLSSDWFIFKPTDIWAADARRGDPAAAPRPQPPPKRRAPDATRPHPPLEGAPRQSSSRRGRRETLVPPAPPPNLTHPPASGECTRRHRRRPDGVSRVVSLQSHPPVRRQPALHRPPPWRDRLGRVARRREGVTAATHCPNVSSRGGGPQEAWRAPYPARLYRPSTSLWGRSSPSHSLSGVRPSVCSGARLGGEGRGA